MATLARQSIQLENPSIGGRNYWIQSSFALDSYKAANNSAVGERAPGWWKDPKPYVVSDSSGNYMKIKPAASWDCGQYFDFIDGEQWTISFEARAGNAGLVGKKVAINTDVVTVKGYQIGELTTNWKRYSFVLTAIGTGEERIHIRCLTGTATTDDELHIRKIKLEKGTKATDWTPAPEDKADQAIIDNWTSDAIKDGVTKINGGYIQTQTINSSHLIVEDIFATGSAAMNIISARELNADLITSGTINANFLSLYGLKVLNKTTNQETLNITDNGEITLRGSVESYNFNTGKTGWAIKHDGDAEFNDVVVRGSVITNDGGIVSGGGSGRNLFFNSSFRETIAVTGWDTTKNGNRLPAYWSGYNSGVTNQATCYHAHLYSFEGEDVYRFKVENETWEGTTYSNIGKDLVAGRQYTFSCQLYRVSGANICYGGLYYTKNGATSSAFHLGHFNFTSQMKEGQWVTCSYTFTAPSDLDTSAYNAMYIYGSNSPSVAGEFYMRRPKLEEGSIATPWSPAPEDNLKQVRFWAGSSYDEREAAPWIVYNDGSMVATKGTFSGVFSGDIKIGNISITDPSSSTGNDAILTITNGSTGVEAVQLTDRGTSVFRQSVVFRSASAGSTDTTISLEPNGTGIFKSSVQVGSGANVAGLENDKLVIRGHTLTHNSSGLQSNSDFFVGEAAHKKNLKTYGDMYATGVVRTDDMVLFADKAQMKIVANGLNIDVFNS